jgi:hypothetical protein
MIHAPLCRTVDHDRCLAQILTILCWQFLWMRKPESATCHYCYRPLSRPHITLDHKTPKIAGGKANRANLVLACPLCNLCKGHTHFTIFLIQISFVTIDATVPLGSRRMKTHVRQWLRRVRSLGLENLATYDIRIAGQSEPEPRPAMARVPITSSGLSPEDGNRSQSAPERFPQSSLSE